MARLSPRSLLAATCALLLTSHTVSAQTMSQATTTVAMNALTSVGCFATPTPLVNHGMSNFQSKGNCQPICYQLGQPVMGIVNGTNCYCGPLMPPNMTQVDDNNCNTPCGGIDTEMCGGNNYWVVYLTGITRNHIANLDPASLSSSSASPTTTAAPQTVVVTQSSTADAQNTSKGSNTVGIAIGVVVGIIVIAGIAFGAWIFMRHKRRRDAEEEAKNQMAVDQFVRGGKHSVSNSIGDSRLDPVLLANKRESTGSIMDNADYSRRILQVRNPDGF